MENSFYEMLQLAGWIGGTIAVLAQCVWGAALLTYAIKDHEPNERGYALLLAIVLWVLSPVVMPIFGIFYVLGIAWGVCRNAAWMCGDAFEAGYNVVRGDNEA